MPIDFSAVKLGKKAAVYDPRTLKLANYLLPAIPAPPPIVDWSNNIPHWGAMGNDQIGDCAIAAPGHMVMSWTSFNPPMKTIPDAEIIKAYSAISGYNPHNGANDNGANMLEVLKYWQTTGIGGTKIKAYATVNQKNMQAVKQAVHLFGGLYIGVELPESARGQDVWDVMGPLNHGNSRPGSWGGHAIPIMSYSDRYYVVTWGNLIPMTQDFFDAYCSEAYVALSDDWVNGGRMAPNCFDFASLASDLNLISA